MIKNLKKALLVVTALYAPFVLTGCAVAVVGAIGAAGVSTVEKDAAHEKAPVHEKTLVVEVHPLEITVQPEGVAPEMVAQSKTTQAINLEPLDAPKSVVEAAPVVEPVPVVDLESVDVEALKAKPVEAAPSDAPASKLSSNLINNTSFEHLVEHAWKIVGMRGVNEFAFDIDKSVFEFSKHGELKAFLSCNYISGKFAADDAGKFFLTKLNSSNNACTSSREQEVGIVSMMLSADEFFINDRTLMLVSQGKSILAFIPTEISLNLAEAKKSLQVNASHSKENRGKTKLKNTKAKSVKPQSVKPKTKR